MKISEVPVWLLAALFLTGTALGAWGEYTWGPRLTNTHTIEKPIITEKIVTQTDTQIQYVPKEVVVYKDPVTGQVSEKPLDGKMVFNKPEFIFTVNGQPAKFTKTVDENFVFEKNMMLLTQTSRINIGVDVPTIDNTKDRSIGIGWSNHGAALTVGYKAGWAYADRRTVAGGLQYRF